MKGNVRWMLSSALCAVMAVPAIAADAPDKIVLTGVIRDFKVSHPDFEAYADTSATGLVNKTLDEEGKPTAKYLRVKDGKGTDSTKSGTKQAITSHESFSQWFRDVPGVNKRIEYAITLEKHATKPGVYVFAREKAKSGSNHNYFFPIDNAGWGYTGGSTDKLGTKKFIYDGSNNASKRNYHFTYELKTKFTFTPRNERNSDLVFEFTGDDDVWVFINGKLAVDLGGVHGQLQGSVNLDTKKAELGLVEGETYELVLFFAERCSTESNFRIETTMQLEEIKPTTVAPTYD